MITLQTKEYNTINQKNYDSTINKLNFFSLACSCGISGSLHRHGFYQRSIKTIQGKHSLLILRVKCSSCGKTHALLLSAIVPYSQTLMIDQIHIIQCFENQLSYDKIMEENLNIDESNIAYILHNYKVQWRERLRSITRSIVSLLQSTAMLISTSFTYFNFTFMQIRCTCNILVSTNHIT